MSPEELGDAAKGPTSVAVVVGGLMLAVQLYTAVIKARRFRRVAAAQAAKHEAEARKLQAEAEAAEAEGEVREVQADGRVADILRKQVIAVNRRMTRLEEKHDREVDELRRSNRECEQRATDQDHTITEQGRFIGNLQRQRQADQMKMDGLNQVVQSLKQELRARGWVEPGSDIHTPLPPETGGTGPA